MRFLFDILHFSFSVLFRFEVGVCVSFYFFVKFYFSVMKFIISLNCLFFSYSLLRNLFRSSFEIHIFISIDFNKNTFVRTYCNCIAGNMVYLLFLFVFLHWDQCIWS